MHHLFLFWTVVDIVIAFLIAQDANKRGMNGVLWGIGVFFLCIVFLPLYLIVRKPMLGAAPPGYPPQYPPPPPAGPPPGGSSRMCPACGKYHDGSAQFCPHCGAPQPR
jgi:hypothetical protein